ncbi:MAG: DUF2752 domain-containing protein [Propionibacteriaceae bacterium]|nr:DUF2752 domain-containing protein [Propionibacteriaceae bacterium]
MVARFAPEQRRILWLLSSLGVCTLVGVGHLLVADPHDPQAPMPTCPTKLVTSLDCPACGGLRMAHSLLHGNWGRALQDNAYLILALPCAALALLAWARRRWQDPTWRTPGWVTWSFLITGALWAVLRNLPSWPWPPT